MPLTKAFVIPSTDPENLIGTEKAAISVQKLSHNRNMAEFVYTIEPLEQSKLNSFYI